MTKKQRDELNKAIMNEFLTSQEDELRKAYREFGRHLEMLQEEMGLSRHEAILFLATMIGQSMRP